MRNFFASLTRDPISLIGAALTTASALIFISLFTLELIGFHGNPYVGILAYLILPAIFVLGLVLIPVGVMHHRRRMRAATKAGEEPPPDFPIIDLNREPTRRNVLIFLALTFVNLVLLSAATYKGVETMDSTEFCGQACHSVMQPEYTAYQASPHARVACVDCHIGPGAPWFVKSKLSGAWQVVSVNLDLYPQPIPTPIDNLRPARETCEQCHWPTKFVGDRLKLIPSYGNDEKNTEYTTVLLLRVGGLEGRTSHGIHWHVDPDTQVRYRSDPSRETIYDVELTEPDGTVKMFQPPKPPEDGTELSEWRVMDCVDCHNRPSHTFKPADKAVDAAIADGRIDRSLPFIKREGLAAVTAEYATQDEARTGIEQRIRSFYQSNQSNGSDPPAQAVDNAVAALQDVYTSNVFPTMDVTWDTYPNHLGHMQSPGCFRCHDDEHATENGEVIPGSDCFEACHNLLAMDEQNPAILAELVP
jgi:hypothetical protein